jgi:HEPN domain-containing protein
MLKYAAEEFYKIGQQLHYLSSVHMDEDSVQVVTPRLTEMWKHCRTLKLKSADAQLGRIHAHLTTGTCNAEMFSSLVQELNNRIHDELATLHCFVLPADRTEYWSPMWLITSPIYDNFPTAWKEFQRAGKCYGYSEATACAFHLQRALEVALKALAVDLGQRFDRNSWDAHLKDIERELKNRYGSAGARTVKEKFYSEAATQFGHMKVAWRNPTMHVDAQYTCDEAKYLLDTVEKFICHLADNGLKE